MSKSLSSSEGCFVILGAVTLGIILFVIMAVVGFVVNALVIEHVWNLLAPVVFNPEIRLLTFWSAAAISLMITYFTVQTNTETATKADISGKKQDWYDPILRFAISFSSRSLTIVIIAHIIYNNLAR